MSAGPRTLLDTNVLVYAFTTDRRAEVAQDLLRRGCAISVQGLNEFTNVARRKLGMSWPEVGEALAAIRTLCPVILPLDVATHERALQVAERHGCSFFDALVIAAALAGGCRELLSEDFHDGLVIDGRLRIIDPFHPA